jgi:hypothetical protein
MIAALSCLSSACSEGDGVSKNAEGSGATDGKAGRGGDDRRDGGPDDVDDDVDDGATLEATGVASEECDMTGIWIARMMTVVEALSIEQCGSQYYYLELRQDGTDVEVVNHFNCGIEGRGTANQTFNDDTVKAYIESSSWIGRKGVMSLTGDGTCELEMEPYWSAFGVDEQMFVPSPRNSALTLAQVQTQNPLTRDAAVDSDNDGHPGVQLIIAGAINGSRHAMQRNVNTWRTNDRYEITPARDWTNDLDVRADYQGEDFTVATTPANDPILAAGATPRPNAESARATLRFLGRDASDPRVEDAIVGSDPADLDGALQTCRNIVDALPAVVPLAFPNPQVCPCPDGGPCE